MNTCFVLTYTEFDSGGCAETEVIGVYTSRKNAKAAIQQWEEGRTLRPIHTFTITAFAPDSNNGPHSTEIQKPFVKKSKAVRARKSSKHKNTKSFSLSSLAIPETLTDGWCFGAITKYEDPDGCEEGDGIVIAPDGSRAGLDWIVGRGKIRQVAPPDERQWGVYEVSFPRPIRTTADLVKNFRAILPQIRKIHAAHMKKKAKPLKNLTIAPSKPTRGQLKGTAALSKDYDPSKPVFAASDWKHLQS